MFPLLPEDRQLCLELKRLFYHFKISQQQTKDFSSIMITSAQPAEGKTTVALAFALGLAGELTHKCLLVDANWMSPELHNWFGVERTQTLAAFWSYPLKGVQQSGVDNLDILAAPLDVEIDSEEEFVKSDTLKFIFEKITGKYSTVIFDTSSIVPNIDSYGTTPGLRNFDSLLLSDFAATSVLVINARTTKKQEVKRAKFALERGDHNIMAVLNNRDNPFYD